MAYRLLVAVAVVLFSGALAYGQNELERFERTLEQVQRDTRFRADQGIPTDQRALIDFGGYATFNFLTLDDPQHHNHTLWQYDLNGYGHANFDGVHDFFVRGRTTYRDFNAGDSFDGNGDSWIHPTLDRAIYRFDLQRAFQAYEGKTIDGNIVVNAGRQLVHWANGLVLSQDIDGGLLTFSYKDVSLTALAGVIRENSIDFETSRPDFDNHTRRGFYGGMLSWQVTPEHKPYVYGLVQVDNNNNGPKLVDPDGPTSPDGTTGTASAVSTKFGYDSYYLGVGSDGAISDRLLYAVELVYEGGSSESNSVNPVDGSALAQTNDGISAGAADARLDYLFADDNHSRVSGELIMATGDPDRHATSNTILGNQPNTPDHAFNGFGLLNTGLAFAPNVSNVIIVRVGGSTFPVPSIKLFERLQVGIDGLLFNKMNARGPIDEDTTDSGYLGVETDVYANWQITSDVSLAIRYGAFFPGDAIVNSHVRNFFYTGLTFSF